MNAIWCSSCISTTPRPDPDASVLTIKGLLRLSREGTGGWVMAFFRFLKASSASSCQANASFFSNWVSGLLMDP